MEETIIEGLPGFLNELNEMTSWGVLSLVVIWLMVREVMRARYAKRARAKIFEVLNGEKDDDPAEQTLTGKLPGNPHSSAHDPAALFTWLVEEFRAHRNESNQRFSSLEGQLGELRGQLAEMKSGGPT